MLIVLLKVVVVLLNVDCFVECGIVLLNVDCFVEC